jgi:hypothetical protein
VVLRSRKSFQHLSNRFPSLSLVVTDKKERCRTLEAYVKGWRSQPAITSSFPVSNTPNIITSIAEASDSAIPDDCYGYSLASGSSNFELPLGQVWNGPNPSHAAILTMPFETSHSITGLSNLRCPTLSFQALTALLQRIRKRSFKTREQNLLRLAIILWETRVPTSIDIKPAFRLKANEGPCLSSRL